MICSHQTVWSGIGNHLTGQTARAKIRSGTQYNCLTVIRCPRYRLYTGNLLTIAFFCKDLGNLRLSDRQMLRILQCIPHLHAVIRLIRLCTQRMNCRSLGFVQHFRLNKRLINIDSHLAAKRINLTNQVPLGASADIRITRHQGNTVYTHGKNNCLKSQSRTGKRRLASRMSRSHNCHIIRFFQKILRIHNQYKPCSL